MNVKRLRKTALALTAVMVLLTVVHVALNEDSLYVLETSCVEYREGRYYSLKVGSRESVELQSPTFNLSAHLESPSPDPENLWRYVATIPVFVMADQSFRSQHPDWRELTLSIVERADDGLYFRSLNGDGVPYFDIDMEVVDYMEWESKPDYADPMLTEAIVESWNWRSKWSPYQRTVVVAFTGVNLGSIYACCDSGAAVILANSGSYWEDDNVLMHEFSHLFFAHDHYEGDLHYHDDCIMSAEVVWVEFVYEDGGIWWVHDIKTKGVTTKNFCSLCHVTVFLNAFRFNPPQIHNGRWYKR